MDETIIENARTAMTFSGVSRRIVDMKHRIYSNGMENPRFQGRAVAARPRLPGYQTSQAARYIVLLSEASRPLPS